MLVTARGAVPVAMFDTKKLPVRLPEVAKLPLVVVPVTVKLDNVPVEVILGCAAVVTVPAVVAAPLNAPTKVVAISDPLAKLAEKPLFAANA